jgi:hypothetical protein
MRRGALFPMREGSFVRTSSALKSLESLEKAPRGSSASSASDEGGELREGFLCTEESGEP